MTFVQVHTILILMHEMRISAIGVSSVMLDIARATGHIYELELEGGAQYPETGGIWTALYPQVGPVGEAQGFLEI
jgi:hypothetical protein